MKLAVVAGEASGDLLGAGLIPALRAHFPDAEFGGIGGQAMRDAGLDAWYDASELSVMGLAEVLSHLPRLLRLRLLGGRHAMWSARTVRARSGLHAPHVHRAGRLPVRRLPWRVVSRAARRVRADRHPGARLRDVQ